MSEKRLEDALKSMKDGDLLLFRQKSLISCLGRGSYSHAAMFAWWNGEPFCLEVLQGVGGRAIHLRQAVRENPGQYDVFRANHEERWGSFDRQRCVQYMSCLMGCRYGYEGILKVSLLHLPLVRLFLRANTDDSSCAEEFPFCSQAVTMAYRLGGNVDPVPQLADHYTEPSDLARSPFFGFLFSLLPDKEEKEMEVILYEAGYRK
ncbi:MAG: hypothetical protein Q4E67_00540 [Planctomycetia bacterium]|nr:hypothetical protein [Planctomycetia bacterium]MDO5112841.1 hypothetical protein [Planctomycetia bacterium]